MIFLSPFASRWLNAKPFPLDESWLRAATPPTDGTVADSRASESRRLLSQINASLCRGCCVLGGGAKPPYKRRRIMTDLTLRQNILDELEFEPSIDAAHIGVAVEEGIVTLTGHVSSYWEKTTAENVVKRVKGVKGIAEEIEVRLIGQKGTADDEIARRAVDAVTWNVSIPRDKVQVKVQDGWITLTGKVEWQYQKNAAAEAVRGLAGVVGVANQIEITPRASVPDVKKRIEDALKRDAEVEAQAIRVNVRDGRVTLEGKVKAWSERQAAERAAWSTPGVRMVEDRIAIV
ncbi:osmotically-inducible protein OsmY [Mesorhizobium sp. USDA 4775]